MASKNDRPRKDSEFATRNGVAAGEIDAAYSSREGATGVDGATSGSGSIRSALERAGLERGGERAPHTLRDAFADERNDVLAVISELEDQLDRQQDLRESLERELRERSEQLQAAQQRIQEVEWQNVSLSTRVEALETSRQDVVTLEEELGDAAQRINRLTEQLALGEKERGRLKQELKAATKQLEEIWALRKERDGLRSDIKTLRARCEEFDRSNRELSDERVQLQARGQDAATTIDALRIERNELQAAARAAEDRQRELLRVQEALTDKIEELRVEKQQVQAQLTHTERENQRVIEQRQMFENEVMSLRNLTRNSETALTSVKKAFAEVRVALSETKARARRRSVEGLTRFGTGVVPLATDIAGRELPIGPTGVSTASSTMRTTTASAAGSGLTVAMPAVDDD